MSRKNTRLKGGMRVKVKETGLITFVKEVSRASQPQMFRVPTNPKEPVSSHRYHWYSRDELKVLKIRRRVPK